MGAPAVPLTAQNCLGTKMYGNPFCWSLPISTTCAPIAYAPGIRLSSSSLMTCSNVLPGALPVSTAARAWFSMVFFQVRKTHWRSCSFLISATKGFRVAGCLVCGSVTCCHSPALYVDQMVSLYVMKFIGP